MKNLLPPCKIKNEERRMKNIAFGEVKGPSNSPKGENTPPQHPKQSSNH